MDLLGKFFFVRNFRPRRAISVLKGSPRESLVATIQAAAAGESPCPAGELRRIAATMATRKAIDDEEEFAVVSKVVEFWRRRYDDWLRRTSRNPLLHDLWKEALGDLEVKEGSGLLEERDDEHRTMVGDFAEIVGLIDTEQ